MTRFILRVDDVGQGLNQNEPDVGLVEFLKWWDAGGWGTHPIYLGVVPSVLDAVGLQVLKVLQDETSAEICLHGWDHHPHILTGEDIEQGRRIFPEARAVIPPYNKYDLDTIHATWQLGKARSGYGEAQPVLFGGFYGEDHPYGLAPRMVEGVLHLSAHLDLYKHCYRMIETVETMKDPGYPVVITAHYRWDAPFLNGVGELRKALEGRLVSVDEAHA